MKIMVTGASGLLGANVTEWMTSWGYEVNVLVRKTSNLKGLQGLHPKIHYGDIQDSESIYNAAIGCSAVIHCAANTRQWGSSREEHDKINLGGTKAVIAAAAKAGIDKVIYVSTANTFPFSNHPSLKLDTAYVESKLAAENYVLEQDKVKADVINPSFMIGPRDAKPSSGEAILHYMSNNPVFAPAGGKSFIHVRDVAEAIQKVCESSVYGKRYLLANHNMSYRNFFRMVSHVTGRKKLIIPIPPLATRAGGALGSLYGSLTNSLPKLTLENAAIINNHLYYDGSESYSRLNLQPRSIEAAIKKAVDWFIMNGYIK